MASSVHFEKGRGPKKTLPASQVAEVEFRKDDAEPDAGEGEDASTDGHISPEEGETTG